MPPSGRCRPAIAQVVWYPDGTDGWAEAGLTLEPREPVTRPDE